VVVARPDDPLVVALLACDATVKLYGSKGYQTLDLDEFLQQRKNSLESPALVVEIAVPLELARRRGALALVARTPADAPIVAACAVIGAEGGRCSHVRLALGGVAETPCLAPEAAHALASRSLTPKALGEVAAVVGRAANPTGDYRGSIEYRRAMAEVLSRRALLQAAGLAE
jgi:CO/xanthine dehydrogenase FAD-binding subunit